MKKFISVVLSLMLLIGAFASVPITIDAVTSGDYQYGFIGSKGIEIEKYSGKDETVDIPTEIDGYTVISIGDNVFHSSGCTKVNIPNTVTSIGDSAFERSQLMEVTIPDSVTSIGWSAFSECPLRKVTIGNKVKTIENFAFSGCTSLQEITIGKNVKTIDVCAFDNCTGLTTVKIPDNVTKICESAFSDCIGLSSLTIGKNVKYIEENAFQNCYSLKNVDIPNSVKSLNCYAFNGCKKLSNIYYNGTNHEWEEIVGCNGDIDNNYKYENAKVHFLKRVSLSKCKVLPIGKQHYNGKKIKPYIDIKDGKFYLFGATDYKLSYKKNKNIGKATVIIKGKGCYTGTIKKTFRIVKGINPMKVSAKKYMTVFSYKNYTFKNIIKVKKAKGKVRYKKISGASKISVNSKTGTITVKSGLPQRTFRTIKIKVTASGNKKYKSKSKNISISFWIPYN
ncbi:MAG: leucine-rich repeat domain-containing protein [Ruminococcus sp.]|nr:leucine-rich repeat domain-containing protein [Ruminococcus sp.]